MNVRTLPFLGKRDYVHGSTLLDMLLNEPSVASYSGPFSFKLLRPLFTNTVAVEVHSEGESAPDTDVDALLQYGSRVVTVRALPLVAPLQRELFEEEPLRALASFDDARGRVRWQLPEGASSVRFAVLLFKTALLRERPMPPPGQWLFARMDGHLPRPAPGPMELELLPSKISHMAMARIACGNGASAWGSLYFVWHPLDKDNMA